MELKHIYKIFPNSSKCIGFLEETLWRSGPVCPYCGAKNHTVLKEGNRYHCNTCNTSFSVTVRTIFHKTKCDLQKWFYAIYLVRRLNKNITIRYLAKKIEVAKATAMLITNRVKNTQRENEELFETIIKKIMQYERKNTNNP